MRCNIIIHSVSGNIYIIASYLQDKLIEAGIDARLYRVEDSDLHILAAKKDSVNQYLEDILELSVANEETLEKADMIMKSNMYTVGLYLKQYTPDKAIKLLNDIDINELYEKGRKVLINKIKVSKLLYKRLINSMLETSNETYNATIIGGISGFFKLYDYEYNAREINITADYPLYNNLIGKFVGIEFMEKYIESIYIENELCKMFDMFKVESLLNTYSLKFSELVVNISSIILTECIGCILSNEDVKTLSVTKDGINKIYEMFYAKSKEDIYGMISNSFRKIEFSNISVENYFAEGLESIKFEIYNGYKLRKIDKIFITQVNAEYS